MSTRAIPKWAIRQAAKIESNVEDFYANRVTWEEFHTRQVSMWDQVNRGELPFIGSACHRRNLAVRAALMRDES